MTDKPLLTKKELAERWSVSEKSIDNWRLEGVIKEVKGLPVIRFNLEHIQELEGTTLEAFSPVEKRRLERENEQLKKELTELKNFVQKTLSDGLRLVNF